MLAFRCNSGRLLRHSYAGRATHRASRSFTLSASRRHNSVTEQDLAHFSKILPPTSILSTLPPFSQSPTDLDSFNNDWMGKYSGKATTVLKPKTAQEVSEIVKWCAERDIAIVPQGGNTGLVGGSIPLGDELVLSLASMNNVRSFDPVAGVCAFFVACSSTYPQLLYRYSCCRRRMYSGILVRVHCTS